MVWFGLVWFGLVWYLTVTPVAEGCAPEAEAHVHHLRGHRHRSRRTHECCPHRWGASHPCSLNQCFGSGLDPDSIRAMDPYPEPDPGGQNDPQKMFFFF